MNFSDLPGFAVEKTHLEYTDFWDWFVAYDDIGTLWKAQSSYMWVQLIFIIGFFNTLHHALRNGGRFKYLWLGIVLHGLVVEMLAYNLPDIDNFWHSQTPIIFLGRRLPLYIIAIYPVFDYTATVAVDKFKLPKWSEPLAVGLVTVLLDYPYDVIGARYMHWTWHDTDPNVSDKHYHIPWNSFYFHTTFAASFNFWFHFTRRIAFGKTEKWESNKSVVKELTCTLISALLGMPGGVLVFIPIYHPLHDFYNIHSEVTFFLLLTISLSLIWLSLSINSNPVKTITNKCTDCAMLLFLSIYYLVYLGIAVFIDPASEISMGFHEQIGPCDEKVPMMTALGTVLYKRKYFCVSDNDETYFGWSCLPDGKPPKDGAHWYTICGAPWGNKAECIVILSTITILGYSFFTKAFGPGCFAIGTSKVAHKSTDNKQKVKRN